MPFWKVLDVMVSKFKSDPPPKRPDPKPIAPGARVLIRDEEWLVRGTRMTTTGGMAVHVVGLSELVRNKQAIFLTDLDPVTELKPEETELVSDRSGQHRRARLYIESLLRRTPPTDGGLYIGHRAAMDDAAYQLEPAVQALSAPRPRILIADGVGIGKTIEVGVLLSELIRRGRGERILVVTLKSILAQFQKELWARFTIPLVRLDSVGIQRVRARIPSNNNPFYYFNRVIISIDTLKSGDYRRHLEQCQWDAVVIDECQHVAIRTEGGSGQRSSRSFLAELLANTTDALILTSATPHDGRATSFASLMNLLEPTAIADPSNYAREDIQGLFIRRFKKDIQGDVREAFKEREVKLDRIPAGPEENAALVALSKADFKTALRSRDGGGFLFRTLLLKAFLSSPEACLATLGERRKKLERMLDRKAEDKAKREHFDPKVVASDLELLGQLEATVRAVSPGRFGKIARLLEVLAAFGWGKKKVGARVVIFSERIATLELLREELTRAFGLKEGQIQVFEGSLDDQVQKALVASFGAATSDLKILLASDVASEGINLHYHCHRLIHFDIPWSLITLEQRNGRIDRYGQRETPEIRYLLTTPADERLKGDLRILERLIEKEKEAHKNIGDVAWLMQLHDAEREEERVALAIEAHESPERVVPDVDAVLEQDPLLQLLLGGNEARPKARDIPRARTVSLFADDLAYAREAFEELATERELERPEWHEHLDGFTLLVPDDLERRFAYLPPELRPADRRIKLTQDRGRVKAALDEARRSEDLWPEWQLFWDLHPVTEWLNERVLARFHRHAAPVIHVEDFGARAAAFLFQGILSNRRSQPMVVEWFGVVFGERDATGIESFDELIEVSGLRKGVPNRNGKSDHQALEARLPGAVKAAEEHMKRVRKARGDQLLGPLKDDLRRLKDWHARALETIDAKREAAQARGRKLTQAEEKRLAEESTRIEHLRAARDRWLSESMSTVERPYIRLVAVLAGREVR